MSNNAVKKPVGETSANAEPVPEKEGADYERPETVKVGPAAEVTKGPGTKDLDGYYGPGWTRWW